MKYLALTIVGVLGAVAGEAIFAATQYPFQAKRVVVTNAAVSCGAGFYNEGYLLLAAICIIAACVVAVIALDYLRSAAREGRAS